MRSEKTGMKDDECDAEKREVRLQGRKDSRREQTQKKEESGEREGRKSRNGVQMQKKEEGGKKGKQKKSADGEDRREDREEV